MSWEVFTKWFRREQADFRQWRKHFRERGIRTRIKERKLKDGHVYCALEILVNKPVDKKSPPEVQSQPCKGSTGKRRYRVSVNRMLKLVSNKKPASSRG